MLPQLRVWKIAATAFRKKIAATAKKTEISLDC